MNEREKRDFQAGLEQEVDAFLRGDTTRRTFITRFGQMTGMLAVSGPLLASMTDWAIAQQKLELADPASPLGQAQALALKASSEGPADGSAFRATEAAKQFSGVTLNMTYEAGLQALDPRNFSGPMWEQLTGIKSNVVELSNPDQYSKAVAEHIAGSGAYDVLDISPAWTPSLADGGVIAPLDDYIAKYMNMADMEDYHPLYKALPTYKGKIWGFFDDGDMFALYYRKDIFEDPKMMEAYQAKFNAPLGPPKTWEEYAQIAQFITDQMAPNVYGAGHFRKAGSPGNQFDFLQQFRANGGKLFGDDMKAGLVSDAGVKTLAEHDRGQQGLDPRQQRARRGVAVGSVPDRQGGDDLFLAAVRPHGGELFADRRPRSTSFRSRRSPARSAMPSSRAIPSTPPATTRRCRRIRQIPRRPICSCSGPARRPSRWRAACCLTRCAIRTASRTSNRSSMARCSRAPRSICANLNNSANVGLLDPIMPGAQDYFLSIDRMCTSVWAGADPKASLETAATEWNETTDRLGVDSQKAFYTEFLKLPGATADNTVEKLGMAVKL